MLFSWRLLTDDQSVRPSTAGSSLMPLRRAPYHPAVNSAATTQWPISSQPACRKGLSGWRSEINEEQSALGLFGARTSTSNNNNANTVQ